MWDAMAIRKLRSSKGYFSCVDVVKGLKERGINITAQSMRNKEHGRTAFTAAEIKAMADMYGLSIVDAFEIFA